MNHIPPAKKLGQHFLTNPRTIARIADAVGVQAGGWVAEIGPGTGALTTELLSRGAHVLAIEMDERCWPVLEDLSAQYQNHLRLVKGDALQLETWLPLLPPTSPICGNLPYNVGTEIVASLLTSHTLTSNMLTFMLQKEVVQRFTAVGPSPHWGRLGVLTHLLADARKLFDVPPGAFHPPPKVMSSIMQLKPLTAPRYPVNMAKLDTLLRTAFGQRRKMLRGSLKGLLTEADIAKLGLAPTARPEELSTAQLCQLANALLH